MTRGDDYAYELTEAERRTLDRLLERVSTPDQVPALINGRPVGLPAGREPDRVRTARSGRLRVALAAASVAVIALVTAFIPSLVPGMVPGWSPSRPSPSPTATQASTVDILAGLAAATDRAPATDGSQQEITMVVTTIRNDRCRDNGYRVSWRLKQFSPDERPALLLDIDEIALPAGPVLCGRTSPPPSPVADQPSTSLFSGRAPDEPRASATLWGKLATSGTVLPDLSDPRTLAGGLDIQPLASAVSRLAPTLAKLATIWPGGDAAWWTGVMPLLCSPLSTPALRSAAFALARDRLAGVTVLTEHGVDLLGRAGPVLRVPYAVDGQITTADLTFDPATGDLLQRTVHAPPGLAWTTVSSAYR